jgi:hypothetical protein
MRKMTVANTPTKPKPLFERFMRVSYYFYSLYISNISYKTLCKLQSIFYMSRKRLIISSILLIYKGFIIYSLKVLIK